MPPKKKSTKPTSTLPEVEAVTIYRLIFTASARGDVGEISDVSTRAAVLKRVAGLNTEPTRQGKALGDDLKGLRSVRAAGQRYRVLYRVFEEAGRVVIVVVGIRQEGSKKDVYKVASKRLGT
ncbi:type II toxin-antitoxin system YhaV family toxin [Deinococcus detaillensis]|uniref:Type II toxin-antitoxin system YhaV family toxin n=1 Tax=Deinococcus detaillensis TaxID=2592048 RepID=A0A553UMJ7_9DEIO|nr:type II toxin-antitoxin system RelE/ParE family toxin [Deinococcus detaillensis]TSA81439.1 type II toxin-antitoxin system YhaV family toxin [Deinococcus detaillensis]